MPLSPNAGDSLRSVVSTPLVHATTAVAPGRVISFDVTVAGTVVFVFEDGTTLTKNLTSTGPYEYPLAVVRLGTSGTATLDNLANLI